MKRNFVTVSWKAQCDPAAWTPRQLACMTMEFSGYVLSVEQAAWKHCRV